VADLKRDARTFAIGAGCGFLAGAFLVCVIVWQFGNVIGSKTASLQHPARLPAAVDRWHDGMADLDVPVLQAETRGPAPTTGATPAPTPANPVLSAVPTSAGELAGRHFEIPVEGVRPEQLVRSFEERRSGTRAHEAIDILAPRNTPVKAVEDGAIARLFYSKAGGNTIYQFDPTERFCYYYAHLERYADGLREGDRVRKGQVLGYVGTSGNAPKETPHMHFAVFRLTAEKHWWEGTPLDPYDILR
jgi:murein DD-endopeptidase MepM/ murein hydrolase activator NlpD